MKIRRVQHDDYETEVLEEKKTEVATSSFASQTEREIEESDSASNFSVTRTYSTSSSPRAASSRPQKTEASGSIHGEQPDAPLRPVRGRPPSKRAFHNFLAALRPLMAGASAAAVVARGADLWAAMDEKQRRPFRRAALRARRMRTHRRRSGRSLSSSRRPRRRSRHPRHRVRSTMSHHTIAFVPRVLGPSLGSYSHNVRARAQSVRSSPARLPVNPLNRSPRHHGGRDPCPVRLQRRRHRTRSHRQAPILPMPPAHRSAAGAVAGALGAMPGGGLILRAALRMNKQQQQPSRPPSSLRGKRSPRSSQRRRTRGTMTIARWQQCSRNRARPFISPMRPRVTHRRPPRSRSHSGAERRSRSRVRRPRPHAHRKQQQQQQAMAPVFRIRQAPLSGGVESLAPQSDEFGASGGVDGGIAGAVALVAPEGF